MKLKLYERDGYWWLCAVNNGTRYWIKRLVKVGSLVRL